MKMSDLSASERLALGGLVRLLVRADGDFSEAEEEAVNRIGEELGGAGLLWSAVSDSAQSLRTDQDVRRAGLAIERPEVRALVLAVLGRIAHSDAVAPSEEGILLALRAHWAAPQ
jgi:hypothetical protein